MPKFLEAALRHEANKKGLTGDHADSFIFGTLNKQGYMHGNEETAKGRQAGTRHAAKKRKRVARKKNTSGVSF